MGFPDDSLLDKVLEDGSGMEDSMGVPVGADDSLSDRTSDDGSEGPVLPVGGRPLPVGPGSKTEECWEKVGSAVAEGGIPVLPLILGAGSLGSGSVGGSSRERAYQLLAGSPRHSPTVTAKQNELGPHFTSPMRPTNLEARWPGWH